MEPLNIYVSDFINYCKFRKTLNYKTVKAYETDLKQFLKSSDGRLNKSEICKYISSLHKTYKPKTCKRKIATLKAFTHFLLLEDIIDNNPFNKIETNFREPSTLPKTIPLNIINRILKCAYSEQQKANTNFAKKVVCVILQLLKCYLPQEPGFQKCVC